MNYNIIHSAFLKKAYYLIKNSFIPCKDNGYTSKLLESKLLVYFVIVIFIAKIITVSFFIPFPKNIFFADITKIDLINLLNQDRQKLGLNPLTQNNTLDKAAYLKGEDMIQNSYFSHQSPEGITPWFWFLQAGYDYKYAGENLAIGFVDSKNVYDAWLNSPSHKENLLNPNYKEIGTAVLQNFGNNNATIVVQLFGSPLVLDPAIKNQRLNQVKSKPQIDNNEPQNKIETDTPSEDQTPLLTENTTDEVTVIEKVLAGSTKYPVISKPDNNAKNTFYLKFLNFIVYNNNAILQRVSYGLLILISVLLLFVIFSNFQVQKGSAIIRSLMLIATLYACITINQDIINQIIPYRTATP